MNVHKNARTTPNSRALRVHRVVHQHWPVSAVAMAFGISERTVYKWLARYRAQGAAGLLDRSSVARRRPHALGGVWLALIRVLRHAKLVAAEIMGAIYFEILQRIERRGYDVFSERVRVPKLVRARIALQTFALSHLSAIGLTRSARAN